MEHGNPTFVLTYQDKNYICSHIIRKYRELLHNDLNRKVSIIFPAAASIYDISLGGLPNIYHPNKIRKVLLANGYKTFTEFEDDYNDKLKILNSSYQNGEYQYCGVKISYPFIFLGSTIKLKLRILYRV